MFKYDITDVGAQLDHIIINNKWKSSLQDVRVYTGADWGSDHNMMVGEIKLKLRKVMKRIEGGRRIDSNTLRDARTKDRFKIELNNRFQLWSRD